MGNDLRAAREQVGYFRLWFGYLGGAVVWTIFHLVSYLWASTYCGTSAEILINGTTAISALLTLAATWVCYTNWRKLRDYDADSPGVFRYMLLSGIYLNLIYFITIISTGIAVWFLHACPG